MRPSRPRPVRTAAAAAAVIALIGVSACGGDPEPDARESPTAPPSSDAPEPLTGQQLREALIELDDIPADLGESFDKIQGPQRTGSDEMLDGPAECAAYLDGDYGPDEVSEYRIEYRDAASVAAVYTTIRLFEPGDADDELDAIRDLFDVCKTFTIAAVDDTVDTLAVLSDVELIAELADVADEGLYLNFELTLDGLPLRLMRYVLLRVDDLVSFVGVQVDPGTPIDPLVDLALTAADKLHEVADQAP